MPRPLAFSPTESLQVRQNFARHIPITFNGNGNTFEKSVRSTENDYDYRPKAISLLPTPLTTLSNSP